MTMDSATKQKIESYARDCTIGAGVAEEYHDTGRKPARGEFDNLARVLGRPLTHDDEKVLRVAWDRCLQEAMQP